MNRLIVGIMLLPVFVFFSCEKDSPRCFTSAGKNIREERILNEFSHIHIKDIFNLLLVQDSVNKLILEGGENLLPAVSADVHGDTLIIENSIMCNWLRDYNKINITIHFVILEHLVTTAPVSVISNDTLRCDFLEYYAIGEIGEADLLLNCGYFRFDDSFSTLGKFEFAGRTGMSRFFINYGSSLYADNLKSENTDIMFETTGNMYINVTGRLRVWIWGPGTLYYSGNPETVEVVEQKSTGRVIKVD